MLVRLLQDVEGEGVLVLVGVADGQPAVLALHHEELHLVRGGGRLLRLPGVERVEGVARVRRVVAEAVGVGDGGGERLAERRGLHHLEAYPAHRQLGRELADEAAEPGARTQDDDVAGVHIAVVVADGVTVSAFDDLADFPAAQEGVPAGRQQLVFERELGGTRLDRGIALAPQGGGEVAAQGGVEGAGLVGGEELVAAGGGVLAGQRGLGDGEFEVGAQRA